MQRWKSKVYKLHNVSAIYESAATQKGDFNLLCIVLRCKNFMSSSKHDIYCSYSFDFGLRSAKPFIVSYKVYIAIYVAQRPI